MLTLKPVDYRNEMDVLLCIRHFFNSEYILRHIKMTSQSLNNYNSFHWFVRTFEIINAIKKNLDCFFKYKES